MRQTGQNVESTGPDREWIRPSHPPFLQQWTEQPGQVLGDLPAQRPLPPRRRIDEFTFAEVTCLLLGHACANAAIVEQHDDFRVQRERAYVEIGRSDPCDA